MNRIAFTFLVSLLSSSICVANTNTNPTNDNMLPNNNSINNPAINNNSIQNPTVPGTPTPTTPNGNFAPSTVTPQGGVTIPTSPANPSSGGATLPK